MQTQQQHPAIERTTSLAWFERAAAVIPGGVYGHTSPVVSLPMWFPYYAERSEGCYFYDVDGNRYLDFLCAYGPIILGHQHPEVEAQRVGCAQPVGFSVTPPRSWWSWQSCW